MQNLNILIRVVNISAGILYILVGIPLVMRKVPMNKIYGFRIKESFTSNEAWFKINCYGDKQLIFWSFLMIVVGIIFLFKPVQAYKNDMINVLYVVGPMIMLTFVAILKTILYSKKLH